MAYHPGDVQVRDPEEYGGEHYDARESDPRTKPFACLPHSCDEWVIGGVAEVRHMIADLQKVLERLRPV